MKNLDIHRQLDALQARRMACEHRFLVRLEKREAAARPQVGILMREGREVFYCWPQGGRYFESPSEQTVIDRLIRNNYA